MRWRGASTGCADDAAVTADAEENRPRMRSDAGNGDLGGALARCRRGYSGGRAEMPRSSSAYAHGVASALRTESPAIGAARHSETVGGQAALVSGLVWRCAQALCSS